MPVRVWVHVDDSYASHLDIPITRVVSASVHRVYRVSHLSSEIQHRVSVDALQTSNVHLGTIWMIALASVCLGLIINLNAKLTEYV
jgi:hypothetical protein